MSKEITGYLVLTIIVLLWINTVFSITIIVEVPRLNEHYSWQSSLPLAVIAEEDNRVIVVDDVPFYGLHFPYFLLPLQARIDVAIRGLKNTGDVYVGLASRLLEYLLDKAAPPLHEPPYIISSSRSKDIIPLLQASMIEKTKAEISSGEAKASLSIGASRIAESYTPRYIIVFIAYGNATPRLYIEGLGYGKPSTIIDKAFDMLMDYLSKPGRRKAVGEALSLVKYKLKPLYRLYGYDGITIEWESSYNIANAVPIAAYILASVAAALAASYTGYRILIYRVAGNAPCKTYRPPVSYNTRRGCWLIALGGAIAFVALATRSYVIFLAPVSVILLGLGLASWSKGFWPGIKCGKAYLTAWTSLGAAMLLGVFSIASTILAFFVPGTFFLEAAEKMMAGIPLVIAGSMPGYYAYGLARNRIAPKLIAILVIASAVLAILAAPYSFILLSIAGLIGCKS